MSDYRTRLLAHARDPVVRNFWQDEFAQYSERFATEAIAPIQNKVGTLLSPPAIRNMLGQVKSTIDIRAHHGPRPGADRQSRQRQARRGADASAGRLPRHRLCAGGRSARRHRRSTSAATSRCTPTSSSTSRPIASQPFSRRRASIAWRWSWRISSSGQLPALLRQAVIGNAGSIVAFRIGAEDAPLIASELGIDNAMTLTDTANFSAWAKLVRDGAGRRAGHRHVTAASPVPGAICCGCSAHASTSCTAARARRTAITRFLSAT